MAIFSNLRLGLKLPLVFGLLSLLALAGMGGIAAQDAQRALIGAGAERLALVAETRRDALAAWAAALGEELAARAGEAATMKAVRDLAAAWQRSGRDAGRPAAEVLRGPYVTDNPHPPAERYLLESAGTLDDYAIAHRRLHPVLVALRAQRGHADVLLVNPAGEVIYSVAKGEDFGARLDDPGLSGSGLAQVVAAALAAPAAVPEAVAEAGFAAYPPAGGTASAFVAAAVRDSAGKPLAVLVYRLDPAPVLALLQARPGLGAGGLAWLVAPGSGWALAAPAGAGPAAEGIARVGQGAAARLRAGQPLSLFGQALLVLAEQPMAEIAAPARALGRKLLLEGGLALLVLGGLGLWLARSLARPMAGIAAAVGRIGGGAHDTAVPATGRGDEIGTIARAAQGFGAALARAAQQAEDGAFKGAAFDGSSACLMMMNDRWEITYVNRALMQLFTGRLADLQARLPGFRTEAVVGASMDLFHAVPARAREILSDSRNLPHHAEIRLGAARFSLDINEVQMPGRGRIGFVVEWRDVTEIRTTRAVLGAIDRNQVMAEFAPDGRLVSANDRMRALVGKPGQAGAPSGALEGQPLAVLLRRLGDAAGQPALQEGPALWTALQGAEPVFGRFALPGGGRLDGGLTPVLDEAGQLIKVVLLGLDVTRQLQALAEADAARQALQQVQAAVVSALQRALAQLAEGDLAQRLPGDFPADHAALRADFNAALARLGEALAEVSDNAVAMQREAGEISGAADDLSRRTERQAATLEETAAALDTLTASVRGAAQSAGEADHAVGAARGAATRSGEVVQQAVTAMREIEASSQEIRKIISVIDDIAFQTNLLALNAGVEAARAGEAGRGFAVVASEVRALAQRSADAAREIGQLISASGAQVRRGVDLVHEAGASLEEIGAAVADIAGRVAAIAESARAQSTSLGEINSAITQLDQVTQQNAAMFEETTAASHAMARGAETLVTAVARFRLAPPPPAARRAAG